MGYVYENEKWRLFNEEGQREFIAARDVALKMLKETGAFRASEFMDRAPCPNTGLSWTYLTWLDRMVELGDVVKLRPADMCWSQYQVYASPQVTNY